MKPPMHPRHVAGQLGIMSGAERRSIETTLPERARFVKSVSPLREEPCYASWLARMERPISLQQFAEISAELDAGESRDEVLARVGISTESWLVSAERWAKRIALDAEHDGPLERRFNEAYSARLDALVTSPRSKPAPLSSPPAQVERTAPIAPASQPETEVDPKWVAELSDPSTDFDERMTLGIEDAVNPPKHAAVLPFRPDPDTATGVIRPVLPPLIVMPVGRATEPEEEELYGSTREIRVHALRDPLPFKRDPNAVPMARPNLPPGVPSGLPFRPVGEAGPPSSSSPPSSIPPSSQPRESYPAPPAPLVASGPVTFPPAPPLRIGTLTAKPSSSPPDGPSAGRPPRLTLEQYAALAAEAAVQPGALAEVRARYGLDEPAHRAEIDEWQHRFAADSELYARYAWLFQGYRDYFNGEH